jgi:hypothetical protein
MNKSTVIIILVVIILLILGLVGKQSHLSNLEVNSGVKDNNFGGEFIHIPKTGGTTIESFLKDNNIHVGRYGNLKKCNLMDKYHCSANFYNLHKDNFTIVRNPYDKIISAYKWRNKGNLSNDKLNKWIYDKLYHFDISIYKDKEDNNIILPQYDFIYKENKSICPNIFKLEEINHVCDFMNKKFDINKEKCLTYLNKTSVNKQKSNLNKNDLNDMSLFLINNIYKKDFEYFNYDKLQDKIYQK